MGIFEKLLSHHHDNHRHHEQHHCHQHHYSHNTPSVINHDSGPVCPHCQCPAPPGSRLCQPCGKALSGCKALALMKKTRVQPAPDGCAKTRPYAAQFAAKSPTMRQMPHSQTAG